MEFRICDALNLPSLGEDGFDVVFSNACIQWVPDHPRLIRDMLALLRPGGMLAVQVPMNYQEPIHRIIGELAASDEWRAELASARIFHTLSQEAYFDHSSPPKPDSSRCGRSPISTVCRPTRPSWIGIKARDCAPT